jgi:lipopolysaccharide transport system ATP-binding protein
MKPILEINNISKEFRIQHEKQPYLSLRDSIVNVFKKSGRSTEQFYALKDVSFNVEVGESVGVIGKNGAGKSTLLKILSKITPPTKGTIKSRGRIASLLEVGTGFHPELTGRENVYLNGSILGMKRTEIDNKFDEIVDFSGTEKFLDTPLKHFSSGMQLRLAFSVAAFLEPEILVIDEVLAVGDAEFQKKCIGKMDDVSKSGRTVILVSHNLSSVKELCRKVVYLKQGEVRKVGEAGAVIENYIEESGGQADKPFIETRDIEALKKKSMYFKDFYYSDENGVKKKDFYLSEDIYVNLEIEGENKQGFTLFASVASSFNNVIFSAETPVDSKKITLKIDKRFLTQGTYMLKPRIHIPAVKIEDIIHNPPFFNVIDVDSEFVIYNNRNYFYGNVMGNCKWIKK